MDAIHLVNHFWGWDFTRTAYAHGNAARFGLAGEGLKRSLILFYQNVGWEKKVTSPWYKDVLMFDCLFVSINYYTGFNLHGTLNSLESVHLPWTGNISSIKRESKNIINYLVFSPMSNNKNFLLISSHTKNKTNVISFFQLRSVRTMHIWKNNNPFLKCCLFTKLKNTDLTNWNVLPTTSFLKFPTTW